MNKISKSIDGRLGDLLKKNPNLQYGEYKAMEKNPVSSPTFYRKRSGLRKSCTTRTYKKRAELCKIIFNHSGPINKSDFRAAIIAIANEPSVRCKIRIIETINNETLIAVS
jgi:hypothetical protein